MYLRINPVSYLMQTLFREGILPSHDIAQGLKEPSAHEPTPSVSPSELDNQELPKGSKIDLNV